MITVTIDEQTHEISDLRQYTSLLEKEYILLDARYRLAMGSIAELKEQLAPIADNAQFIRNVYTKPKPSDKKISAQEAKEQRKLALMNKMITRGKKV